VARTDAGRAPAVLALVVAIAGAAASLLPPVALLEETAGLPLLFRLRGARTPPPAVAVVGIDRRSSEALGLPADPQRWPREAHAALLAALAGARVVAFDLFFTEAGPAAGDAAFAAAIRGHGNVLLATRLRQDRVPAGGAEIVRLELVPPTPALAAAARGTAPFPLPVVPLRVSRWWRSVPEAGDVATMPVAAVRVFAEAPTQADTGAPTRAGATATGGPVPAAAPGPARQVLNFYGPPGTIPLLPYAQLVARGADGGFRPVATPDVAGRIVFVGYTEREPSEQKDTFYYAFSADDGRNIPGVEVAATAAANLLDGRPVRVPGRGAELGALIGFGLAASAVARRLRPAAGALALAALGGAWLAGAGAAFATADLWLPLLVPVGLQLPLAFVGALLLRYRDTRRQRERIAAAMGRYLPPRAVARLATATREGGAPAEEVFSACLATDAAGYANLSETLGPAELRELLNRYYGLLFAEVEQRGGIVSDVVGDAMLALWPGPGPDPALRRAACTAALAIAAATARPGEPAALPTRIGVDCGPVALGDVGAGGHYEFRAVGDIVNTAARVEALNKPLGTRVLVTAATLAGLDGFDARPLGRFILPGKTTPVAICELRPPGTDPRTAVAFAVALAELHAGRVAAAAAGFTALADGDGPARFYADLCDRVAAGTAALVDGDAVRVAAG
jgi:adenylate cyclase